MIDLDSAPPLPTGSDAPDQWYTIQIDEDTPSDRVSAAIELERADNAVAMDPSKVIIQKHTHACVVCTKDVQGSAPFLSCVGCEKPVHGFCVDEALLPGSQTQIIFSDIVFLAYRCLPCAEVKAKADAELAAAKRQVAAERAAEAAATAAEEAAEGEADGDGDGAKEGAEKESDGAVTDGTSAPAEGDAVVKDGVSASATVATTPAIAGESAEGMSAVAQDVLADATSPLAAAASGASTSASPAGGDGGEQVDSTAASAAPAASCFPKGRKARPLDMLVTAAVVRLTIEAFQAVNRGACGADSESCDVTGATANGNGALQGRWFDAATLYNAYVDAARAVGVTPATKARVLTLLPQHSLLATSRDCGLLPGRYALYHAATVLPGVFAAYPTLPNYSYLEAGPSNRPPTYLPPLDKRKQLQRQKAAAKAADEEAGRRLAESLAASVLRGAGLRSTAAVVGGKAAEDVVVEACGEAEGDVLLTIPHGEVRLVHPTRLAAAPQVRVSITHQSILIQPYSLQNAMDAAEAQEGRDGGAEGSCGPLGLGDGVLSLEVPLHAVGSIGVAHSDDAAAAKEEVTPLSLFSTRVGEAPLPPALPPAGKLHQKPVLDPSMTDAQLRDLRILWTRLVSVSGESVWENTSGEKVRFGVNCGEMEWHYKSQKPRLHTVSWDGRSIRGIYPPAWAVSLTPSPDISVFLLDDPAQPPQFVYRYAKLKKASQPFSEAEFHSGRPFTRGKAAANAPPPLPPAPEATSEAQNRLVAALSSASSVVLRLNDSVKRWTNLSWIDGSAVERHEDIPRRGVVTAEDHNDVGGATNIVLDWATPRVYGNSQPLTLACSPKMAESAGVPSQFVGAEPVCVALLLRELTERRAVCYKAISTKEKDGSAGKTVVRYSYTRPSQGSGQMSEDGATMTGEGLLWVGPSSAIVVPGLLRLPYGCVKKAEMCTGQVVGDEERSMVRLSCVDGAVVELTFASSSTGADQSIVKFFTKASARHATILAADSTPKKRPRVEIEEGPAAKLVPEIQSVLPDDNILRSAQSS